MENVCSLSFIWIKTQLLIQGWSKPLYKVCKEDIDSLYIQPAARRVKTHKVTAVGATPTLLREEKTKSVKSGNFRIEGMVLENHFKRKSKTNAYGGS